MEKDLYGDYTPTPHRHVVLAHFGRDLSVRIHDTNAGATKQDTTNVTTGDDPYSYKANTKKMFGITEETEYMWKYLDNDHGNDEETKQFLQAVRRGDIDRIKEMQKKEKQPASDKNDEYKVWRMKKTALQIASEKGCFEMVHLLKDAEEIKVQGNVHEDSDVEATVSQEVGKMFAKANPAYLCLKEKDPIIAALEWPSEFKKVFGDTDTLSILRDRYSYYERQLTQFTEDFLDCCLTNTEVGTLLNRKSQENGDCFRKEILNLADYAVRRQRKGIVTHRKSQFELQQRWLRGVPNFFRWGGNRWYKFFLFQFCCWLFYGLLSPVHPMFYALPYARARKLISSPKGKFFAEQFSAIFFAVALFIYEVLNCRHPIMLCFLCSWILGYLASELIQLKNNCKHYFQDFWNILDWGILISFGIGVLVRFYSIKTGHHILLVEKMPALTLVFAMLRRMQNFYLSELVGKMFLIFVEMKTEVFRFLVIFGYVVLAFACSFCLLYYDVKHGILTPFLNFQASLLHLTMKVFSETTKIEYLQLLNQNITVGGAQRNGTDVLDASGIYDFVGFMLYAVFLMMAILILLKLCVAMMTSRYSRLQENIEQHWYAERSKIWLEFIRRKIIFPPPYNLLEILVRVLLKVKCKQNVCSANAFGKQAEEAEMIEKNAGQGGYEPSYEELIKILKVRYFKVHGCKNCKIHGLMKET